jgi:hypothetical protein
MIGVYRRKDPNASSDKMVIHSNAVLGEEEFSELYDDFYRLCGSITGRDNIDLHCLDLDACLYHNHIGPVFSENIILIIVF